MKLETLRRSLVSIKRMRHLTNSSLARVLRVRRRIVSQIVASDFDQVDREDVDRVVDALKAYRSDPLYKVLSIAKRMRAAGATDSEIEAIGRQLSALVQLSREASGPQGTASGAQRRAS